jgi:hypothetical protein
MAATSMAASAAPFSSICESLASAPAPIASARFCAAYPAIGFCHLPCFAWPRAGHLLRQRLQLLVMATLGKVKDPVCDGRGLQRRRREEPPPGHEHASSSLTAVWCFFTPQRCVLLLQASPLCASGG